MEDLLALNGRYLDSSRTLRRSQILINLSKAIVFFMLIVLNAIIYNSTALLLIGAVASTIYFYVEMRDSKKSYLRQVEKIYRECEDVDILGNQEVELGASSLSIFKSLSSSKISYSAILSVQTDDHYAFIYLSSLFAIVIPRFKLIEGDFDKFIFELNHQISHSRDGH